jgi:hypothetical protein
MKLNLMTHAGAEKLERGQLLQFKAPESTRSFHPIPHAEFANIVQDALEAQDFRFGDEAHAVGRQGNHYFGMAELRYSDSQADYALVAGWRSSYDKTLSAGFTVGSQVFVCDNLAFNGENTIGRKHTTNIMRDFPVMMTEAVAGVIGTRDRQIARFNAYKEYRVSDREADQIVIDLYRNEVIPARMIGPVIDEFDRPSHAEFLDEGRRTIWTLFNGVTEVLKESSIWSLPKRTTVLHNVCDSFIGLEQAA